MEGWIHKLCNTTAKCWAVVRQNEVSSKREICVVLAHVRDSKLAVLGKMHMTPSVGLCPSLDKPGFSSSVPLQSDTDGVLPPYNKLRHHVVLSESEGQHGCIFCEHHREYVSLAGSRNEGTTATLQESSDVLSPTLLAVCPFCRR